jgi:hypothetical protein
MDVLTHGVTHVLTLNSPGKPQYPVFGISYPPEP